MRFVQPHGTLLSKGGVAMAEELMRFERKIVAVDCVTLDGAWSGAHVINVRVSLECGHHTDVPSEPLLMRAECHTCRAQLDTVAKKLALKAVEDRWRSAITALEQASK